MNKLRSTAILALAMPTMAQAASVANSIIGCKGEADTQKVAEFMAKNDSAGLERPISVRSPNWRTRLLLGRERRN
jgi:hypothetical protein